MQAEEIVLTLDRKGSYLTVGEIKLRRTGEAWAYTHSAYFMSMGGGISWTECESKEQGMALSIAALSELGRNMLNHPYATEQDKSDASRLLNWLDELNPPQLSLF